ncbi:hypothetical protein HD806DRAFT_527031 [Xylariaceae sp. AK1471]|nr:hypothetical protein HD806DRAFT_527031 [Xylariaceae sp. AK1471]
MQFINTLALCLAVAVNAFSTPLGGQQDKAIHTYKECGGYVIHPKTCAKGYMCIRDPRKPDITDLPGICVPDDYPQCAGFGGLECFPGPDRPTVCYDFPQDDCNPDDGGADCIGICLYPL